ncbi:hypothetical protein WA588_005937 [Blastocystis sp. NMH]
MKLLVGRLLQDPQLQDFYAPLDYKALGLRQYPLIVKYPMDLGTIKSKLEKGIYKDVHEALFDIESIWNDCALFNGSEHYLTQIAETYKIQCRKAFNEFVNQYYVQNPNEYAVIREETIRAITSMESRELSSFLFQFISEYSGALQRRANTILLSLRDLQPYQVYQIHYLCLRDDTI